MNFISEIFSVFCILVFISNLDFGSSMGMSMGGGSGIVYISNNRPTGAMSKQNDMLLINQKGCSPTIIKNSYKGKDILVLGQCNQKKKVEKKIEYVPVPMPVKEYVPVEIKKEMPMKMEYEMPMKMNYEMPMKMDYGMDMKMGMDSMQMDHGMYGMDTRRSEIRVFPKHKEMNNNSKDSEKQLKAISRRILKAKRHSENI